MIKHGGTVLLFVAEYMLSRVPVATPWFSFPLGYATIYAAHLWTRWAVQHWWVYWVFDWRTPANLKYYLVQPLLGLLGFMFMCGRGATAFMLSRVRRGH